MAERSVTLPVAVMTTWPFPAPLSVENVNHEAVVLTVHETFDEMFSTATPLASMLIISGATSKNASSLSSLEQLEVNNCALIRANMHNTAQSLRFIRI